MSQAFSTVPALSESVPALPERSTAVLGPVGLTGDRVLTTKATAAMLGVSESVLRKWRMHERRGPRFVRFSKTRVGYRESAIWAFVAARERSCTLEG